MVLVVIVMNKQQAKRKKIAIGIQKGKICPYCFKPTEHVSDVEVYSKSYGRMIYICRGCDSYVGCHKGSPLDSLGRLANKELRDAKIEAHYFFDYLWNKKIAMGFDKKQARGLAYKWLAEQMRLSTEGCHIGYFNVEECKRVVEICKPFKK